MIITADSGLGTTYERWALNKVLVQICTEEKISSVFEGPGDGISGIMGINSLPLGLRGLSITIMLNDQAQIAYAQQIWTKHASLSNLRMLNSSKDANLPFLENEFDLAWNFNVMVRASDPFRLLDELCRISRKAVLIVVPNSANYSFILHRLQHKYSHNVWDHGSINLMKPNPWKKRLTQNGLNVKKIFYVDCPWWPDIVDIHEFITDFLPWFGRFFVGMKPEHHMKWEADKLPYFQPQDYPDIHAQMERLAFLEKIPIKLVNRFFGHHVAILAVKPEAGK